jgi:hypothetical protein
LGHQAILPDYWGDVGLLRVAVTNLEVVCLALLLVISGYDDLRPLRGLAWRSLLLVFHGDARFPF